MTAINQKYQPAIDAYHAHLKAAGHNVAMSISDDGASEHYIITYGRGSYYYVHTLIEGGAEPVAIKGFETLAAAMTYLLSQAAHTYLYFATNDRDEHYDPDDLAAQVGMALARQH